MCISRRNTSPRRDLKHQILPVFVALIATSGAPATLAAITVEITNLPEELRANVAAHLDLERRGDDEDLSDATVRRLFADSEDSIARALRPFGFYEPNIAGQLSTTDDGWLASFVIDPGPPVVLEEVHIDVLGEGSTDPKFVSLLDQHDLVIGEPLRHDRYDQLKIELARIAAENGYFEAEFTRHELIVDTALRRATVHLELYTGPRYRLGSIAVDQDFLDEDVVTRVIDLEEGEYFDVARLQETQYALYATGLFSLVDVDSRPDPETAEVPLTFRPEPTQRHRWTVGGGYSTDTRVEVHGSWQNRLVNRRGHNMSLNLRLSEVKQDLLYRYVIPYSTTPEYLTLVGGLIREERGDTRSSRVEIAAVDTRYWGPWQRDLFGIVQAEESHITDVTFDDLFFIPGIRAIRTNWNDVTRPTQGYKVAAELRGSSEILGAATDYVQIHARSAFYVPLSAKSRFYLRGEVGATAVENFAALTASQRFFAGGSQNVRGYALNELSPVDAEGNLVGGRHLIFGSVEFELDVRPRWTIDVFADIGNAVDSFGDPLEYSVGIGARWRSPIGLIGIDIAKSLSTAGKDPRLHLSIRPEL
jgi:translocation and assembly module TamA